MKAHQHLVILGAGIGGLSVVRELSESGVSLADVAITIVDDDFSHFLGFTLPWVMRGWRDEDSVAVRPTADALHGIRTVTGWVRHIDPAARTVTLDDSTIIPFDALVIATGARNAIHKVPGLQAAVDAGTAVHYYSANAAADAHRALQNFTGGKLVFLVTSAPYRCPVAPYEGALLAADLLRDNGSRDATQIAVYSPEQQPMPSAGPYAGQELITMLATTGIDFHGEHSVARVDADGRCIEFQDGRTADFDLLVFIPPHEPAVTLDGPGWITVDVTTMQTEHPGIFAIGDATAVTSPPGGPCPRPRSSPRTAPRPRPRTSCVTSAGPTTRIRCPGKVTAISTPGRTHRLRARATSSRCLTPRSISLHPPSNCTTTNSRRNKTGAPSGNTKDRRSDDRCQHANR